MIRKCKCASEEYSKGRGRKHDVQSQQVVMMGTEVEEGLYLLIEFSLIVRNLLFMVKTRKRK